jgi:hypothetical protein
MHLPRLLQQCLRLSNQRLKPSGRRVARSAGPRLELLEDRTLLSTWVPKGPAPLLPNPPVSGRLAGIAVSPTDANTIYVAAAGGGVWKTTNAGSNWTALTDNQVTLSMGAIALAPSNSNVIYAGTGEANNSGDSNYGRGILVSTDGGANWTLTGSSIFNKLTMSQIAVDPTDPNIAYAAVGNVGANASGIGGTGLYKTTNGGATWTNTTASISTGISYSDVKIDPSNPSTVYMAIGTYFTAAASGVYKSTNAGATWTRLSGGLPASGNGRIALAIAPSNTQVIYASIANPTTGALFKMMRSDDGGSTWTDLTSGTPNYVYLQGWYDTTLIVDPSNSAIVYAGGAAGPTFGEPPAIIRSINSGVSWSDLDLSAGVTPHADHHAIAFDANGKLLDGGDGGIYRLDSPSPVQWSDLNGNLNTIQFQGIDLHPTNPNIVVGGSQDNGTEVFNGSTWNQTDGGDGGFAKFSPTNANRVYHNAPPDSFGSGFFRRSDNGGSTWVNKTSGLAADQNFQDFYAPFVVDPGNGDRVLYGTDRIWETTTGGDSWATMSPVLVSTSTDVDAIGLAAGDVNTVYAAFGGDFATSSRIFVTTNHGASWVEHDLPAGNGRVADLQVDPANAQVAYAVVSKFNGGHVFRTINGGVTWTNISGNLPNLPTWTLQLGKPASGDVLYVGNDDGVYSSTDIGVSWSPVGDGLPHAQVFQLVLNATTGILGAATHGRGLWTVPLTTTLTITGTSGDDTITVHNLAGDPTSVEVIVNGASVFTGAWSDLGGIVIAATSGNDTINIENDAAGTPITVNLGNGADVVNLSPLAHNLGNLMASVAVNGGGGADTLNVNDQGTATAQSWTVAANSLTRSSAGPVSFGGISTLIVNGGDGNNTYTITGTQASLGTTLNTGAGTDTVNVQGAANPVTINSASGSGADVITLGSASNVLSGLTAAITVTAASTDTLALNDQGFSVARTFVVTATTIAWGGPTVTYSGLAGLTIHGGTGGNTFIVSSTSSTAMLTIAGGGGNNTLVGPNADSTWNITAQNAGTLVVGASTTTFSAIQNLIGGSGADTFILSDGAGVAGNIDGGAGSNTLNEAAYTAAVVVDLLANTATGVGGNFANLQSFVGGSASNILNGPAANTTWNITGSNAGTVSGGFSFSAFQNLTGGAGDNTFVIGPAGSVGGTITGGGGTNTLDYSAYTASVIVDLQTGQATATGGEINVVNVHGANSAGPGLYNLLIGNGGNVLTGGSGRPNLLVAGASASTLNGGNGEDLLIGGTTTYDTEAGLVSWQAIATYWAAMTDPFSTQVTNVETGNGVPVLDNTTVTANGGGNVMNGSGGLALIYTDGLDTIGGFDPGSIQFPIVP